MNHFWTYMLRCSDGSYYVGHTDDVNVRLVQHQQGTLGGYTASRRPVELVWSDVFDDHESAYLAERQIKGWSRAKKEALIRGDWAAIQRLASRAVLRDAKRPSTSSVHSAPQDERNFPTLTHADEGLKPQADSLSRSTEAPIIVLVRPQLGENIGKAARAMLNFRLVEMRLVAPRDGWPNPDVGPAASGADEVLEKAQVFDTVAGAVADCAHVYAATVRKRGVTKPVVTPEAAAQQIATREGRSAILFGPERSGLDTDELALARTILTIPINPQFASLNLAQAVIVCAYEWSKALLSTAEGHCALSMPTIEEELPPAPQEELEGLVGHFEELLEPKNYFFPAGRADTNRRTLRNLLTKPGWNHLEIRTLRGVLTSLSRNRRDGKTGSD